MWESKKKLRADLYGDLDHPKQAGALHGRQITRLDFPNTKNSRRFII